jgi:hypothetical protein
MDNPAMRRMGPLPLCKSANNTPFRTNTERKSTGGRGNYNHEESTGLTTREFSPASVHLRFTLLIPQDESGSRNREVTAKSQGESAGSSLHRRGGTSGTRRSRDAHEEVTMNTPTELPRRTGIGRLAAGALVAIGLALAAAAPASADDDWGGGHKHWKNQGYYHPGYYPPGQYKKHHKHWKHRQSVYYYPYYSYYPQPVYVAPPPVYYYPPVYYGRPSISVVLPIHID